MDVDICDMWTGQIWKLCVDVQKWLLRKKGLRSKQDGWLAEDEEGRMMGKIKR